MKTNLSGRVVIVTGGSSGIGRACAVAFGAAGARLVITGRDATRLAAAADALRQNGTQVLPLTANVAREDDCRRVVAETVAHWGGVGVLVNNAGISMRARFADVELDVLRQVMDTNFWGTVCMTHAALPHLLARGGSVVGVSSIAGYRGLPGRTGYSASKAAVQGFLEALRTETLPQGLHVLVACPGFTASNIRRTALTAQGLPQGETPRNEDKMMSADAVAGHIVRAVQTRRRDLVLTTQGRLTVFLNKWVPGLMDRLVYRHFAREPDAPLS